MTAENQIPASAEQRAALDAALGLKPITVRVPAAVFMALKHEAELRGVPLTALARHVLCDWVRHPDEQN